MKLLNLKIMMNKKKKNNKNESRKNKSKKYITIDGIKQDNITVDVQVEKIVTINEEDSKGRILDAKK